MGVSCGLIMGRLDDPCQASRDFLNPMCTVECCSLLLPHTISKILTVAQHRVQAKTSVWICAGRAQSLGTSMWNDPPWVKTGVCAGQRLFGSLRRCATPKSLLTVLQEDRIGQADFGVKLESLCKAKLHQEKMTLES